MNDRPTAVDVAAPAKVNLTLRILEREPSGYHRLETLFQAVDLTDRLRVERSAREGVTLDLIGPDLGPEADNLAVRAARAYLAASVRGESPGARVTTGPGSHGPGVHLRLEKRIPAGAGLGGGSSDAAATLRAMDAILGTVDEPRLRAIAAELGSDVSFFLSGSPYALARGRGEVLTPLEPLPVAGVVLGLPAVHVATGRAYERLAEARRTRGGSAPPSILGGIPPATWAAVAELALNDFEEVVVPAHPEVGRALRALREAEGPLCLLSGSGGAVFSIHRDRARAEEVAAEAAERAPDVQFVVVDTASGVPPVVPVA